MCENSGGRVTEPGGTLHEESMRLAMLERWLGVMVVLAGCELGSKSLGEDPEETGTEGGSGEESSSATSAESTTGAEPPPTGELLAMSLHEGVAPIEMALGADDTLVVLGRRGFVGDPPLGGMWSETWIGGFALDGTLQWEIAEPLAESESPESIATDDAGNIYTLYVDYTVLEGGNNRIVKRDAMGAILWTAVVQARPGEVAPSDDGVLVVGALADGNGSLAWAQAFDADGVSLFERTWENDIDEARSLFYAAARHGDAWILGGGRGVERWSSASRAWLLAIDDAGATTWERLLTEPLSTEDVFEIESIGDEVYALGNFGPESAVERVAADGTALGRIEVVDMGSPRSFAAASDGSVVIAGGRTLPPEDPDACMTEFGPCSSGVRTARFDAMGTRWLHDMDECTFATSPVILDNGESIALAGCGPDDAAVLGLLRYAP